MCWPFCVHFAADSVSEHLLGEEGGVEAVNESVPYTNGGGGGALMGADNKRAQFKLERRR